MGRALAVAAADPRTKPDGRRHRRVKVSILGRCMFEDRRECVCQIIDISLGGVAVVVPAVGRIGERVVAYVDQMGRFEGRIVRLIDGGFAMTLKVTPHKQEKLVGQLTWLANRDLLHLAEDRRHERIVPASPFATLVLADGSELRCRVLDVSPSGAAVQVTPMPAIGSPVRLGKMRGRVVRHADGSVGVEFAVVHSSEAIKTAFEPDHAG